MFAVPGAQPIVFRSRPDNWSKVSIEQVATYDYVWALEPQADIRQYLGAHADPVGTASGFTLWRLRKHSEARNGHIAVTLAARHSTAATRGRLIRGVIHETDSLPMVRELLVANRD